MLDMRIMKVTKAFLAMVVAASIIPHITAARASAQAVDFPPDCHEAQYHSLLEKQDAFVVEQNYRAAEQTAYQAAVLRLKCANNAKSDSRAYFLDDFAGQMEMAMGNAAHIHDDSGGCDLLRADRSVLKKGLETITLSARWKKTLTARLENALIYKGACGIVNGHYAI